MCTFHVYSDWPNMHIIIDLLTPNMHVVHITCSYNVHRYIMYMHMCMYMYIHLCIV